MSDFSADYSDADAVAATDGVIDADTVDGTDAADLGAPASTQTQKINGGYYYVVEDSQEINPLPVTRDARETYVDGARTEIYTGFVNSTDYGTVTIELLDALGTVVETIEAPIKGTEADPLATFTFGVKDVHQVRFASSPETPNDVWFELHEVTLPEHSHDI